MRLGHARLAVQIHSSPGLATKILIPAPGLGSGAFIATACVVVHLRLYVLRRSHNINVRTGQLL